MVDFFCKWTECPSKSCWLSRGGGPENIEMVPHNMYKSGVVSLSNWAFFPLGQMIIIDLSPLGLFKGIKKVICTVTYSPFFWFALYDFIALVPSLF